MHKQTNLRPCFHRDLLRGVHSVFGADSPFQNNTSSLQHLVIASLAPVFNLGGDLEYFSQLIKHQDRDQLHQYAMLCIDAVHGLHHCVKGNTRSIALVQGDALGGGMELALACQTIVMEEQAFMGLPEVLFGLFPGMGAYSFLRQRVTPHKAEEMILSGKTYSAEELLQMGVVDVVVSAGQGEHAVRQIIRRELKSPLSCLAMNKIRSENTHISHQELIGIGNLWVDTALQLTERQIKMMERIVRAQKKLAMPQLVAEDERSPSFSKSV